MKLFFIACCIASFILLASLGSSQVYTYQQNRNFSHNEACIYNGTYCSSSFSCNFTLIAPDTGIVTNNQIMTRNGSYYNYSEPALSQMGIYKKTMICVNGNLASFNDDPLEITADGKPYQSFPVLFAIIIFGIVMFILDRYIGNRYDTNLFQIFGAVIFIIAGILVLYPGFNYTNATTLDGDALGIILIGIGGFIFANRMEEFT